VGSCRLVVPREITLLQTFSYHPSFAEEEASFTVKGVPANYLLSDFDQSFSLGINPEQAADN
jgi:hypothetical protein